MLHRSFSIAHSFRRLPALVLGAALFATPAAFFASTADATVVVIPPMEKMAARSDVIFQGIVTSQETKHDGKKIITLTTVSIVDGIKGIKAGETLTIYQVGGTYNGQRAWIAGQHEYRVGEEMVFFGVRHRDYVISYGVGVGIFAVTRSGNTGTGVSDVGATVVESYGDVAALTINPDGTQSVRQPKPNAPRALADFKSDVRRMLTAAGQ